MNIDYYSSPIGLIELKANEKGLTNVGFVDQEENDVNGNGITGIAKEQLQGYFSGQCKRFDIPLDFENRAEFYQKVWSELLQIPYGRTTSYLHIAKKLGDANATRAVGMANGKNPIAIIIPCHRVIASNGALTGYAYGMEIKRKLLALENPREYALNGTLF